MGTAHERGRGGDLAVYDIKAFAEMKERNPGDGGASRLAHSFMVVAGVLELPFPPSTYVKVEKVEMHLK